MSDDAEAYVPSFEFTCPPASSSIENTFRMAQVLEKKGDTDAAISNYLLVCDSLERIISLMPTATVDIRLAVFSLGSISDIYQARGDWDKSLAFRNCQRQFLEYLKRHRHLTHGEEEDAGFDFAEVTSAAASMRRLFASIADARALKERPPPETQRQLLRQFHDAAAAERDAQADRLAQMLNRATDTREAALRRSFWKRNIQRVADHPWKLLLATFVIGVVIALALRLRAKKRRSLLPPMPERLKQPPGLRGQEIGRATDHREQPSRSPRAGKWPRHSQGL